LKFICSGFEIQNLIIKGFAIRIKCCQLGFKIQKILFSDYTRLHFGQESEKATKIEV